MMRTCILGDLVSYTVQLEGSPCDSIGEAADDRSGWIPFQIRRQGFFSSNDVDGFSVFSGKINGGQRGSVADGPDFHAVSVSEADLMDGGAIFHPAKVTLGE